MGGVMDACPVLLDLDLPLEIARNAIEFGNHGLDLGDLAPLFVDLEFLKTDKGFA
jgi:hypothetical protein